MEDAVRRRVRRPGRCFFCCPTKNLDPGRGSLRRGVGSRARAKLAGFPNLHVIFNLGAGVDALIADASLPKLADRPRRGR